MIRPTMSHAVNKDDFIKLISEYTTKLEQENERLKTRIADLQNQKADMFWNQDGDMSFDSLEELADYYSYSDDFVMKVRRGMSLTDKEFKFVFDDLCNEWDITPIEGK